MIKKMIMMCCCILSITLVGCGSKDVSTNNAITETTEDVSYDFRNSCWGDSMDDVKNSETLTLEVELEDAIGYSGYNISGIDMVTLYKFNNDGKLYTAVYGSRETHVNKNLYISDYNTIKKALNEKYGDTGYTDEQDEIWYDSLYKDNKDKYGTAISAGHLSYVSTWNTETTKITLMLTGDNFEISLSLFYEDVNNKQETDLSGL